MKKIGWTGKAAIAVFVLTALAGCVASLDPAPDAARVAAIESEVESFFSEYRTAFNAADTDAIVGLYVTDDRFAIYEDGVLRYSNTQAIVDALASLPPGMSMTTEGTVTDITVLADDLASASTTFQTQMTMPDGAGFAFEGVMTALLERSDDGWRLVQAHTSSVRNRPGSETEGG